MIRMNKVYFIQPRILIQDQQIFGSNFLRDVLNRNYNIWEAYKTSEWKAMFWQNGGAPKVRDAHATLIR